VGARHSTSSNAVYISLNTRAYASIKMHDNL
jgi:hypothetical protein